MHPALFFRGYSAMQTHVFSLSAALVLSMLSQEHTFAQAAKGKGPGGEGVAADQPVARTDANSKLAHEQMLQNLKKGRIDIYFVGDSITRRWRATDYPQFLANWNQNFFGW